MESWGGHTHTYPDPSTLALVSNPFLVAGLSVALPLFIDGKKKKKNKLKVESYVLFGGQLRT